MTLTWKSDSGDSDSDLHSPSPNSPFPLPPSMPSPGLASPQVIFSVWFILFYFYNWNGSLHHVTDTDLSQLMISCMWAAAPVPLIRDEDILLCCGCPSCVIFLRQTQGNPWRYFPDTGHRLMTSWEVLWRGQTESFLGDKHETLASVQMCFLFSLLLALWFVIVVSPVLLRIQFPS